MRFGFTKAAGTRKIGTPRRLCYCRTRDWSTLRQAVAQPSIRLLRCFYGLDRGDVLHIYLHLHLHSWPKTLTMLALSCLVAHSMYCTAMHPFNMQAL